MFPRDSLSLSLTQSNSSSFRCLNSILQQNKERVQKHFYSKKKPKLKMSVLDSIQSAFDMGDIKLCYMLFRIGAMKIYCEKDKPQQIRKLSTIELNFPGCDRKEELKRRKLFFKKLRNLRDIGRIFNIKKFKRKNLESRWKSNLFDDILGSIKYSYILVK